MIAQAERRHGMDEFSERIGELRAGQVALNRRMDEAAVNQQNHRSETIRGFADLRREIVDTRTALVAREAALAAGVVDLRIWRARMRGVWAVVAAAGSTLLMVFGRDIMTAVGNLFAWRPHP